MSFLASAGLSDEDSASQAAQNPGGAVDTDTPEAQVNSSSGVPLAFLSEGGILTEMARLVMDSLGASGIAIAYAVEGAVVCKVSCGDHAPPVGTPLNLKSGIGAQCLREGKPVMCLDTESDPRVNTAICRQIGVRSMLAVPLRRDSQVIGVAQVFYTEPNAFSDSSAEELQRSADLFISCLPENGAPQVTPRDNPDIAEDFFQEGQPAGMDAEQVQVAATDAELAETREQSLPQADSVQETGLPTPEAALPIPELSPALKTRSQVETARSSAFAQAEEPAWWKRPTVVTIAVFALLLLVWVVFRAAQNGPSPKTAQSQVQPVEAQAGGNESAAATNASPALKEHQVKARSGDPQAQFKLAQAYEKGDGVEISLPQAYSWYIVSGENGNAGAKEALKSLTSKLSAPQIAAIRLNVARMYAHGIGVRRQDFVAAYVWLILAEVAGEPRAKAEQKILAAGMRDQEIAQARQRASAWLRARGYSSQVVKAAAAN